MRALLRSAYEAPTDGHPEWCTRGHQCTAATMPSGEHASVPEVWETRTGRVVATRYLSARGRGRVEIRHVVELPGDEAAAVALMRRLVALGNDLLSGAVE